MDQFANRRWRNINQFIHRFAQINRPLAATDCAPESQQTSLTKDVFEIDTLPSDKNA